MLQQLEYQKQLAGLWRDLEQPTRLEHSLSLEPSRYLDQWIDPKHPVDWMKQAQWVRLDLGAAAAKEGRAEEA